MNKLNLLLLLAVLGLGLLAYFQPGLEPQDDSRPPLTTLNPDSIDQIRIQRSGQNDIELRRQGQHWQVRLDGRWLPANAWRIKQLLELAQAPSLARFAAEPAKLGQYGLAEPRIRLRLGSLDIAIGDTDPLGQRRYLLIGDSVHLISDRFYLHLAAADSDYVRLAPLPEDARINSLELPGGMRLERAEGDWRLSPEQAISRDRINQLIDEWRQAQAMQVSRHAPGEADIRLRLASGETLAFSQAEGDGEWLLIRNDWGLAYHFPAASRARLTRLDGDGDA